MALVEITGEDSWLNEFEFAGALICEINQSTVRRRQLHLGNLEHSSVSSQLRKQIPQAELQLASLFKSLESSRNFSKCIVPGERERRERLLENLQSSLKKASDEFHIGLPRQGPFTKVADLGVVNWGEDEFEHTANLSNSELRQQHGRIGEAQDAALESLSHVVGSQRRIAKAIQVEVDDQDELLIDIKDRVEDTHNNLEQQTANVVEATRKTSTWGYWVVVILLLIAIIVVGVW